MNEWDKFLCLYSDANFYQSTVRIRKRTALGYQNYILGVHEGKKLLGGGVLLGRRGEFWMAYGPLLDFDNIELLTFFLEGVKLFAKQRGIAKIEFFPRVIHRLRNARLELIEERDLTNLIETFRQAGFTYTGDHVTYEPKAAQRVFVRDLTGVKDADELFASYRKTLRARFRKTAGQVKVEELKREQLPELVALLDESDERHGISGRPLGYFQTVFDTAGDNVRFVVARNADTGEAIAGTMFTVYGGEVMSWLSGMSRKYRDLIGRAYIQDYMMKWALKHHILRINMMGIDGKKANGMGMLDYMVEFKSGFGGGIIEEYVGQFYLILSPAKWFLIRIKRKIGGFL